jgi:hypothetical protein
MGVETPFTTARERLISRAQARGQGDIELKETRHRHADEGGTYRMAVDRHGNIINSSRGRAAICLAGWNGRACRPESVPEQDNGVASLRGYRFVT